MPENPLTHRFLSQPALKAVVVHSHLEACAHGKQSPRQVRSGSHIRFQMPVLRGGYSKKLEDLL